MLSLLPFFALKAEADIRFHASCLAANTSPSSHPPTPAEHTDTLPAARRGT